MLRLFRPNDARGVEEICQGSIVTRLCDLLDFGQVLKPSAAKSPTFLGNFCKGVKMYHFSREIIFGQLL